MSFFNHFDLFSELPRPKGLYDVELMLALPDWDDISASLRDQMQETLLIGMERVFDFNPLFLDWLTFCCPAYGPQFPHMAVAIHVVARKPYLRPLDSARRKRSLLEGVITQLSSLSLVGIAHLDVVLSRLHSEN